jgi:D-3-phosphoglycerate dehydrogenase / 2-oxoglutarate reductase
MKYKILNTIGENFATEAMETLAEVADVDYKTLTQEEFEMIVDRYDALVIGLGLQINRASLEKGTKLKAVATATTGLDHIDLPSAREFGVEILSLRDETEFLNSITGTAELSFGLLIDLMRRTPWAFEAVKQYKWVREDFCGWNLFGKTLGIVGLGRLGKIMARQGMGFGMKIIYFDPNVENNQFGQKMSSLDDLLENSDAVSVHVHLTSETAGMFSIEQFQKMKKSAYLINTSRGKIVDEKDLLEALNCGKIAGYGSDVLAGELDFYYNGFKDHPLVEYAKLHDNCIIVPHIGGMTHDSRTSTDIFIAKKLASFLKG